MSRTVPLPERISATELTELGQAIRRVARSRGADMSTADDVAQETIARLLSAGTALEPAARLPWALTTAGNLLVSMYRDADTARRHRHRLVERAPGAQPELDLLALEEADAVRSALGALDTDDRRLLLDHVEGASTIDLASATESTPGAVAARLHRTRARMRLDYLLALRRVELPTATCRRVLLAVSAADQRRQQALRAAEHFGACPTCTALVAPLARRSSRLAGIAAAPLVALGTWGGRISRTASNHVVQASAATAAVAVAAGAYVLAPANPTKTAVAAPRPAPRSSAAAVAPAPLASLRTAANVALVPIPAPVQLKRLAGQRVIAHQVPVQAVVSHPGFWVGAGGSQRIYVHLTHTEAVRDRIRVGQVVSFTGVLTPNVAGFAAADGVTGSEAAALLNQQGVHLTVDAAMLRRP